MKVIGLGYPRTGTMSLKHALEALQLGPCYHMIEVFRKPTDVPFWLAALQQEGSSIDWSSVFGEFHSTTDCPACYFWKELWNSFPDAKYVLTIRDSETWYDSFRTTVYEAMMHPERSTDEAHSNVQCMAKKLILDTMFEGRFEDKDFAIQTYENHNKTIVQQIPSKQLLIFDVKDGWQPLCEFLEVPTPDSPFPKSNTRNEFQNRFSVIPPTA